jgi:thioredoxin reductase (NADPH)
MSQRYDVAIIGTGPAGLEAAINCKIRNKSVILFGSKNLSVKLYKAHKIDNYLVPWHFRS